MILGHICLKNTVFLDIGRMYTHEIEKNDKSRYFDEIMHIWYQIVLNQHNRGWDRHLMPEND